MKKSIAARLFIMTVGFFLFFITIQLLFQSLFFQNFYTDRKVSRLQSNLESFEKDYINNIKSIEDTSKAIKDFEDKNNAKIAILESNGLLSYITDSDNKNEDTGRINVVMSIVKDWISNPESFVEMQNKGETVTYIDPSYGMENIVCIDPVSFNNAPTKVIFAVSSLQPVDEAVDVIKDFNLYLYAVALLIILILAFLYSKMISKPLIDLNNAALKMAKLDFSEEFIVNREDEIGNLAKTLNFLSKNLSSALTSLKKSNEQLKKDIEKEKKLENMRKEFVAAVSHELKTPISLISGYAEGIKDNIVEGEDKEYYLDVIIDEAEKMGDLVSEMLELSKLESGNYKLNITSFQLDRTINETIKRLEGLKQEKELDENFKIIKSIDENINVLGDEDKIEEVIRNFLTNAIRHTNNEGKIYVRTVDKGDEVLVEVENEGEHINKEDLKKIWERFYKIDKSRNRSLGGTGLGLSIVRHILEMHNSKYGAENTEIGVKFYFTLKKAANI